jgi:hypothetical protein
VLRVDSPHLPEIPAQALDSLPGKRSALLDVSEPPGRARLEELLAAADVLIQAYRPGSLAGYGLAPDALAERHPHLSVVTLSAWGATGPWACGAASTRWCSAQPGSRSPRTPTESTVLCRRRCSITPPVTWRLRRRYSRWQVGTRRPPQHGTRAGSQGRPARIGCRAARLQPGKPSRLRPGYVTQGGS